MYLQRLLGVLAVHALLVTCACAEDVRDRAKDIQRKAIESRQRIENGELRLEIQVWTRSLANAKTTNRHFIFDGRDVRCDYGAGTTVASKTVLIGDEFIKYSPASRSGSGKPKAIEMGGRDTLKGPLLGMFHPLVIGMASSGPGHWYKYSDDSLLGQEMDSMEQVDLSDENGEVLIRRSWPDTKKRLSVRIDPAKDFFVSRIDIESEHGKSRLISSTVNIPTQYDGIWFPSKTTWTRTVDGEKVMEEVVSVTSAQFNKTVDRECFSLAGLDVNPGWYVMRTTPFEDGRSIKVWDGRGLVDGANSAMPAASIAPWRSGAAIAGVVLALLAFVLVTWVFVRHAGTKTA